MKANLAASDLHLPIPADQRIRAAVVFEVGLPCGFEFGDDALGEDFAEFDAPLVEGVDVPEDTLGEDAHFVEGDEAAEDGGGEFFGEDDIGRAVAVEDAVWGKCGGGAFGKRYQQYVIAIFIAKFACARRQLHPRNGGQ